MVQEESTLRERAERSGQGHLFAGWSSLDAAGRERLLAQVASLDLELVARLAALLRSGATPAPPGELRPPELFPLLRDAAREREAREAAAAGEELLATGRVGFLVVAGGQASRLGYESPKGLLPVGPVSGRTLFELHARRLLAARKRYGARIPWYVMTSRATDAATRAYFQQQDHFGIDPEDVHFLVQAMLPAMDLSGRILLSGPGELFLAPNGHGGVLEALGRSGALAHARERGVELLSYFQVDNPLARPGDPLFLGLHAGAGAGMSSKAVAKRDPQEKVGVLARVRDGGRERTACIEYSDLPEELRLAREPGGELAYRAGNIAVHVLSRGFVEELASGRLELPWHVARKRMRVWEDGRTVEREGAKLETFVFDALLHSPRSVTLEVDRRLEFTPVKNARGEDSPDTARADMCSLHARWVRAAGLPLPPGEPPPVEVDPLLAEEEREFVARRPPGPVVTPSGHLYT